MDSAGYRVRKPADEPLQNNSVLSCPQSTRLFALMPYISIQHLREGLFPRPALALSLRAQASGAKALCSPHEEQKPRKGREGNNHNKEGRDDNNKLDEMGRQFFNEIHDGVSDLEGDREAGVETVQTFKSSVHTFEEDQTCVETVEKDQTSVSVVEKN
ncbi:hypothetical protein LWI28_020924 [Acer negundo]|uniref:Uncharacterized protein n=1 Tax=Acer negundo TaxID=4023 RepID=A0AAD5JMV5_ACENE|nr:hypothetical protein LWI28_020924 [Acer negundo]